MSVLQRAIVFADAGTLPESSLLLGAPALLHLCRLAGGIAHDTLATRYVGVVPSGSAAANAAAVHATAALMTLLRYPPNCAELLAALRSQPDGPTCAACGAVLTRALAASVSGNDEDSTLLLMGALGQVRWHPLLHAGASSSMLLVLASSDPDPRTHIC